MKESLPLGCYVDCACEPALSLPLVLSNVYSEKCLQACLTCGKVECCWPVGDEPRGAGPQGGCNFIIPLPEEWYAWLGQWPRLLTSGYEQPLWAPPEFRARSWAEVKVAEESAAKVQLELTPARRLRLFAYPPNPPPPVPPELKQNELKMYVELWRGLWTPGALDEFFARYGCR